MRPFFHDSAERSLGWTMRREGEEREPGSEVGLMKSELFHGKEEFLLTCLFRF